MSDVQSASDNYQGVWGQRIGFGRKPALLLIDFMQGYTTPGAPLYAPGVVSAVEQAAGLLELARGCGTLVVHTNIRYQPGHFADGGIWVRKAPVMKDMVEGNPLAAFCAPVAPRPGEPVISKQYASAFFGTSLASLLHAQGVDTVVLAGCSTSGCIRASAVDAVQHGFRTIVVRECVGDRHPAPHEANLFDIDSKYGDVVSRQEAMEQLARLAG
ncbi:N-carbamoylsarcosine amidohydrolase [Pseudomonas guariconensis]|uniref:N-carbamoylsarcosine amidohydrolase n=1 Tax=Pseudomonas TaxID=286 RepID=UPI001CE4813B|nr:MULTISPECIES: N-carbamoylsarcosine amidohydrolase [Pseudomonas]MCO7638059.1 N-carbamoylsarcosine amidohydrolase [Pseudomonas sp. S 311-6]MCO7516587.1 N-carbamoylsarcosine amidohydrolase [Pseudomonas putida]MCO7566245.1 N-carbamoylsarcosine amidohydrolase [Pseudomonas mosselii]MCO7593022.1 N-carbamoylsarcosine amidohydrolase [Pseudomonas guariconensis]MCO7606901.1 N-carbamoylsarcosine amidohydrolase [Pseudomonas guariconensis]